MEHVVEAFPVERLGEIAGVSARGIARLILHDLGLTPHEFVEGVRIDHARNLLEATELVLKAIALDSAFASPDQMRSAFQRRCASRRCGIAKVSGSPDYGSLGTSRRYPPPLDPCVDVQGHLTASQLQTFINRSSAGP
jgi:hypothetical protein